MAGNSEEEAVRPIIIIKRVEDDHDDHHGGVWKIAFADFMTAMMAFFLVMWLVNAANEETKAQVASYFNPVKLTDAVLAPKGVKSMDATSAVQVTMEEVEALGSGPSDDKNTKASKSGTKAADTVGKTDDAMFKDPYQTLKQIAGEVGDGPSAEDAVLLSRDKSGSKDTDTFRDPFDPEYRSRAPEEPKLAAEAQEQQPDPASPAMKKAAGDEAKDRSADPDSATDPKIKELQSKEPAKKPTDTKSPVELAMVEKEPSKSADDSKQIKSETEPKDSPKKEGELSEDKPKTKRQELVEELKSQLAHAAQQSEAGKFANLSVEATDAGLLVSLTETFGFEMFTTSSAKPTAALIRLMDRISPILKKQNGSIVVRGHTDARPFRSQVYDNWRLSTARAHMARHMLIRGGLDKDRIVRIEGHADRHLKNKGKPFSAENRRIEVLILDDKV
ncbi:MAG: MotB family protein [Rhizobiales bacterium]|nr:MotB family protein [Hyphomicrobiales bacterium]